MVLGYGRNALLASSAIMFLATAPAYAQVKSLDVPAQPVETAIGALGRQADIQIIAARKITRGKRANAIRGDMTVEEALDRLLDGTGLTARRTGPQTYTIVLLKTSSQTPKASPTHASSLSAGEKEPSIIDVAIAGTERPAQEQEIVVTGTQIRGITPVGSQLNVITRADIDRRGFATTQEIVRSLTSNVGSGPSELMGSLLSPNQQGQGGNYGGGTAVNLRGLGSDTTLTLINGRRVPKSNAGTFFDVSQIPASAIARVEVLNDGASALYGSDAIAGVVNFVLRKDFDGFETRARFKDLDGAHELNLGQVVGKSWPSGSVLFAYDYRKQTSLGSEDRDYVRQDQRGFGGRDYRLPFTVPGNIFFGGVTYPIPAGQDGRTLEPEQLAPGSPNLREVTVEILPEKVQHLTYLTAHQAIGDKVELFGEARFSYREVHFNAGATPAMLNVPSSNPFFVSPGPATSVAVQYDFAGVFGAPDYVTKQRDLGLALGLTSELGAGWQLGVSNSWGRASERFRRDDIQNNFYVAQALADPNPLTAFNPFGDVGLGNTQQVIERIRGFRHSRNVGGVNSTVAHIDGPLEGFGIPGIRAALSAEYRIESLESSRLDFVSTPEPVSVAGFDERRKVAAVGAELFVPLGRVKISLAGRVEHYSDFGWTANPRLGLQWEIADGLALRGSFGTSFKAPLLSDLAQSGGSVYLGFELEDPASNTGSTSVLLDARSGTTSLSPERATSWSLGFDWRARRPNGPSVSVTYFNVDYTDRVGALLNWESALAREELYGSLVRRNPHPSEVDGILSHLNGATVFEFGDRSSIGAIVDARTLNIGSSLVDGLDVEARLGLALARGKLSIQANATKLFRFDQAQGPGGELGQLLNRFGYPASTRARAAAYWNRGAFTAGAGANYVGSYLNDTVLPTQRISDWLTFDGQVTWRFGGKGGSAADPFEIGLFVTNLTDERAPFVDVSGGYDASNADPLGRTIALQARVSW